MRRELSCQVSWHPEIPSSILFYSSADADLGIRGRPYYSRTERCCTRILRSAVSGPRHPSGTSPTTSLRLRRQPNYLGNTSVFVWSLQFMKKSELRCERKGEGNCGPCGGGQRADFKKPSRCPTRRAHTPCPSTCCGRASCGASASADACASSSTFHASAGWASKKGWTRRPVIVSKRGHSDTVESRSRARAQEGWWWNWKSSFCRD